MNNDNENLCPRGCALVTVAAQKIVGSCLKLIVLLLERWFDKGCNYSALTSYIVHIRGNTFIVIEKL